MGANLQQTGGGSGGGTLAGDVTGPASSNTVVKVNGASVPVSATILNSNASAQLVDATPTTMFQNVALSGAKPIAEYASFTSPGAGSNNDIYTVPAGKRAIVWAMTISNHAAATASTFRPMIKINGAYYPLAAATGSIVAAAGNTVGVLFPYIAEAGETFAITQTTNTTFDVIAHIIQFDATSAMFSAKLVSPTSGDHTLYTPAAGKNGVSNICLPGFPGNVFSSLGGVQTSGSTVTVNYNYLRGAAAASTSNRILAATNFPSTTNTNVSIGCIAIDNGDSLSLNFSANTSPGLFWLNVLEFNL